MKQKADELFHRSADKVAIQSRDSEGVHKSARNSTWQGSVQANMSKQCIRWTEKTQLAVAFSHSTEIRQDRRSKFLWR